MNYQQNCKTFIHRFDSDPRLQSKSFQNQAFPVVIQHLFLPIQSRLILPIDLSRGEAASKSLAWSLAQSLAGIPGGLIYA